MPPSPPYAWYALLDSASWRKLRLLAIRACLENSRTKSARPTVPIAQLGNSQTWPNSLVARTVASARMLQTAVRLCASRATPASTVQIAKSARPVDIGTAQMTRPRASTVPLGGTKTLWVLRCASNVSPVLLKPHRGRKSALFVRPGNFQAGRRQYLAQLAVLMRLRAVALAQPGASDVRQANSPKTLNQIVRNVGLACICQGMLMLP